MNSTLKTVLLTVLTLSLLTIALIEVSGISRAALFNKLGMNAAHEHPSKKTVSDREAEMRTMEQTTIRVQDSSHNFGTIKEGDIVQHDYIVSNTGDKPLYIANVQTSCGCTAPKFEKEPLLPGKSAVVTLEFDSKGKEGNVSKKARIISNAKNAPYQVIRFDAQVRK